MATNIARAKIVAEGIADKTLTNALLAEIGDAFAYTYRRGETLTNEEKATVFINQLRGFVKQVVRDWKISVAEGVARQTTASTATPDLGEEGALP